MKCRSCAYSDDFELILDLGLMPLAGDFLEKTELHKKNKYDLKIYSCKSCGLVQILDHIDPNILFNQYSFSSSTVLPLVTHFEDLAVEISRLIPPGSTILEIGCNDGILLSPLSKLGFKVQGIDMSKNIVEIAKDKNLDVFFGKFDLAWVENNPNFMEKFDLITCSNSFPHNFDQESLSKAFSICLKNDGVLILEIMYAGDLLNKLQWDTLYHEHLTFHSLTSLRQLLLRNGLNIFDAELIQMHGGSLRIWASKETRSITHRMNIILEREVKENLSNYRTWTEFGIKSKRTIDNVSKVLEPLSKNYEIAAYGAAGKATMWMNACNLDFIRYVVDASPLRYGKYMPGTLNPIISPDDFRSKSPELILVTAWNYLENIKKNESWYSGLWCVPLPYLSFS
jgi:2-polyprenyl-3-methyl-5-hydroxy-6-metoxy-1,4-benzoquinol methylase